MLTNTVYIQIQKQITLRNNDRNKCNRSNAISFNMYYNRFSFRNYNQKQINQKLYYEKESLELLGTMPV
jgi:hypothetical protein